MKSRVIKILELSDDEENILKFVEEECKDKRIDICIDYRDLDCAKELIKDTKNIEDYENKIFEAYSDYITEEEYNICTEIEDKVLKRYRVDELSSELKEAIQTKVYDIVPINIPYDDFLTQNIKVNLFITYNNSNDVFEQDFDYTTLTKFLTVLGYKKPKTILKQMVNGYTGDDPFLKSLRREFINAYTTQINQLCFIGIINIRDYYNIIDSKDRTITIPKNATGGFVDRFNGGGSILSIELPSDYKVKSSNVKVYIEGLDKYTVNDIYGLVHNCYKVLDIE